MVQWLRLRASNARGVGSIPGQGTKIPHAALHHLKKKKKRQRRLLQGWEGGVTVSKMSPLKPLC